MLFGLIGMNVISVVAQFLFVNTVKKIIMQMDMKHVNAIRNPSAMKEGSIPFCG